MWSQNGPSLETLKYCVSTRAGMAGGNSRQMGQGQASHGAFDQFPNEFSGTELYQLRSALDELGLAHGGVNSQYPAGAAQNARIADFALVEVVRHLGERDGDAIGGNDGLQMRADVFVELFEALAQIAVIVKRQGARMGVEREGAQSAAQPRHFHEKLFGVAALGNPQMAQRCQARIDGVHQPEIGQVAGREFGEAAAAGLVAAEGAALAFQNLDEPSQHEHELLAGGNLQAGRHELRVENEMAGAVAPQPAPGEGPRYCR